MPMYIVNKTNITMVIINILDKMTATSYNGGYLYILVGFVIKNVTICMKKILL